MLYRIWMISDDEIYGSRLKDYWRQHCGRELEVKIFTNEKEIDDNQKPNLIILDENKQVSINGVETVTLVSDIEKVKEPVSILKYGKPQELYYKILTLCENDKILKKETIELKPITIGKENYMELNLNEEYLDKYAVETLRNCPIEGLIPIHQASEDKKEICYYTHGKISLSDYMMNIDSDRVLIQILKDIFDILIKVEDYMLNRNNLLLDTNNIYLHQITKKPSLIYIPSAYDTDRKWLDKYRELLAQLSKLSISENNNSNLLKIKLEEDKEEAFVVREALNCVDKTEYFQSLQKNTNKMEKRINARLYWVSQKKDIYIDRKIFKIGKEKKYVDLCIEKNMAVSRNHADVVTIDNDIFIIDKNSMNHTYINGKQIPTNARILLHNKDSIRIANEEFIFYK